jgi:hypothetical protein
LSVLRAEKQPVTQPTTTDPNEGGLG